jgi:uncharacterized protein (DUF885 family)
MPDQRHVHDIAEQYVDERARLDPLEATQAGITDYDALTTDLSPDGFAARVEHTKRTLRELESATARDEREQVAGEAMRERLGLEVEMHEAGLDRSLNVITSPMHWLREAYDLMPTDNDEQWSNILSRLRALPDGLDGVRQTMRADIAAGLPPKSRQVQGVIKQTERIAADFFTELVANGPQTLKAELDTAAEAASAAFAGFGHFLADDVAPDASDHDPAGRDAYRLASRYFLGAEVDLDETYDWGIGELARVEQEMAKVAQQIVPGGTLADAFEALESDPARNVVGTAALQAWMQDLTDRTIDSLSGVHFDIPEPIRAIDCKIAPTKDGGIYYTGPSEDFSRPGTMWWSVPEGQDRFGTWFETTTVFHEGVPGHHLQVSQVVYRRELLNRWQRLYCWVSGHGEGWALYAERLMADLGYLDDPGDRLGMLDAQALRAARVVVDMGVHLGKEVPAQFVTSDGISPGTWDYDAAWKFLRKHVRTPEEVLRFELDRYLGWPGQAPSYKVGERIWLAARDDAQRRQGDAFDLKEFHRAALDLGAMGLDPLRVALGRL